MTTSNALPADSLLPVPAPVDAANTTLLAAAKAEMEGGGTFAQLIDQGDNETDNTTVQPPPDVEDGDEKKDNVAAVMQMGLPIAFAPAPVPVMIVLATDAEKALTTCAPVTAGPTAVPLAASKDNPGAETDHGDEATTNIMVSVPPVQTSGLAEPQPSGCEASPEPVGQRPQVAPPVEMKSTPVPVALPATNASAAATVAEDDTLTSTDDDPAASTDDGAAVSTAPVRDAGMRSANTPVPMKMTAKTERNADPVEQNLPHRQIVPDEVARRVEALTEKSTPDTPAPRTSRAPDPAQTGSQAVAVVRAVATEPTVEPSHTSEVRAQAVDRLTQAITEQVLSFKRTGNSSLDVSMRPDRNTELSLHLTMRNGQVEVSVRLERGQFEMLQVHWGELQQTLAQQGVRVGQLTSSSAMGDQAQSQFWQQGADGQAQERRFEQSPESLDELPLGGAPSEPLHQRAHKPTPAMRRGWEMWA